MCLCSVISLDFQIKFWMGIGYLQHAWRGYLQHVVAQDFYFLLDQPSCSTYYWKWGYWCLQRLLLNYGFLPLILSVFVLCILGSIVGHMYVCKYFIFLMNWPFDHYKMFFFLAKTVVSKSVLCDISIVIQLCLCDISFSTLFAFHRFVSSNIRYLFSSNLTFGHAS